MVSIGRRSILWRNDVVKCQSAPYADVLRSALTAGQLDIARFLIDSGLSCDYLTINEAIMQSDTALATALLETCPQTLDIYGSLHSVIACGDISLTKQLLAVEY
jgi:hypothetical protein